MKIIWREHAQWRMAERSIEPDTVMAAGPVKPVNVTGTETITVDLGTPVWSMKLNG